MNFVILPADLEAVRTLRDSVLRPGLPRGASVYPGDDEPDTLHVGAFFSNEMIAVASVCRESPPGESDPTAWRVRGMATLPDYRGQGLARRLLMRCLAHARTRGGQRAWCTARVAVAEFYQMQGFIVMGEQFVLPQYSDELYIRMDCPLAIA